MAGLDALKSYGSDSSSEGDDDPDDALQRKEQVQDEISKYLLA